MLSPLASAKAELPRPTSYGCRPRHLSINGPSLRHRHGAFPAGYSREAVHQRTSKARGKDATTSMQDGASRPTHRCEAVLAGGHDIRGPRASRPTHGWEGHWWLGESHWGWGEPWTSEARSPADVDGEGKKPPSARQPRSSGAVEIRIEHPHLGDAVHRQPVLDGNLADRLGGRPVIDAKALLVVGAEIGLDPGHAGGGIDVHDGAANVGAFGAGRNIQPRREVALHKVTGHLPSPFKSMPEESDAAQHGHGALSCHREFSLFFDGQLLNLRLAQAEPGRRRHRFAARAHTKLGQHGGDVLVDG